MRAFLPSFTVVLLLLLLTGCRNVSGRYVGERTDLDPKTREAILQHRVILGMYPDEAIAAVLGADHRQPYTFRVKADPAHWPERFNPRQVLVSQRARPDNSEIDINFWSRTQFNTTNVVGFNVVFTNGRAASITRTRKKEEDARLNKDEATRIAREAATKEGYRLADYRKATANYGFLRDGFWVAFFHCKAPTPDKDFKVWINDRSGEVRVEPGN